MPVPEGEHALLLGRLFPPGRIELYDQPRSPWRLGGALSRGDRNRIEEAGGLVDGDVVAWPDGTLKVFMLNVLAHEVGHHVLQHERRLQGGRGARTRDHEAQAEMIAARLRKRLE
jgi:hypothetical protein